MYRNIITEEDIHDTIYSYFYEGVLTNDTIKYPLQVKRDFIRGKLTGEEALEKIYKCAKASKQYRRGFMTIKEYIEVCEIYLGISIDEFYR